MMDMNMLLAIADYMDDIEEYMLFNDYVEIPEKYITLARKLAEEESEFYGG